MTAIVTAQTAGRVLAGKYRLIRPLGEGAFGEVWLSEQLSGGPEVVLKLLHAQWARVPSIVERFRREAVASNRISHPNVCKVFEYALTEDDTPFISMEFLSGGTLKAELTTRGAMPLSRVAELMAPVCEAVAAAHQVGIVHRDLKPDNIMLTQRDGKEQPIVLDFGIAKLLDATEKLTQTGSMLGTPAYMSPEQCQGKTDIGPAADIYSLAIIVYELLVGTPPFTSRTLAEMAMKHVLEPPAELASIPKNVADVIAKCLAKDPKDRPPAGLLAGALREGAKADPTARATTLEVPNHLKLNPGGDAPAEKPAAQKKSSPAATKPQKPVVPSYNAATVVASGAGKEIEARAQAHRARTGNTGQSSPVAAPAYKKGLSTPVLVMGLVALALVGALVGLLLR